MANTMRGFAYISPGQTGWLEKKVPFPGPYEALVKPTLVSVCTSDIHNVYSGASPANCIMGHEGIGEIVEVGSEVKDFKPGDKVVIPCTMPDWRSREAQLGIPQHSNGYSQGCKIGTSEDGLFSEYTLIHDPDFNLAHLPDDVNPLAALMLGDMVTTGFQGAEIADIEMGDTVVVMGSGPVGLMACAGAKLLGASRIIGVEARSKCIEVGLSLGVSEYVDFRGGDVAKKILKRVGRKGVDRTIITFGNGTTFNQAMKITRLGGTISNISQWVTIPSFEFNTGAWGFGLGNKTIKQSLCPGGRIRMEKLINMVRYGRIDPSVLITHTFEGLDSVPEAYKLMAEKPDDLIKTAIYLK